MEYYELLEHTADLGIRAWGKDMSSLFINSASAMYDLIADIGSIKPSIPFEVEIEAQDRDGLLRDWLSELLYYFHTKDILLGEFIVKSLDDRHIISTAKGEKIDKNRHDLKHEIKAVTFHNLKILEKEGKFITEIIFDV